MQKSILVLTLIGFLGLAVGQQFYSTENIVAVGKDSQDYFFCVPINVFPTGPYMLAAQIVLEKADSILIRADKDMEFKSDFSLPKQLAIHTIELKTATSTLPIFDEEKFLSSGCFSAVVHSQTPILKVIVGFMAQDPAQVKPITNGAANCARFLEDIQKADDEKEPKPTNRRSVPFFAIFSLAAGVVMLICSLVSCCCICARRRCNKQQCCKNQAVCAAVEPAKDSAEMSVVTEQVPAIQETVVTPQPAAFYYIPAGIQGGQYTPMQLVAPTSSTYPGAAVPQFVVVPK